MLVDEMLFYLVLLLILHVVIVLSLFISAELVRLRLPRGVLIPYFKPLTLYQFGKTW